MIECKVLEEHFPGDISQAIAVHLNEGWVMQGDIVVTQTREPTPVKPGRVYTVVLIKDSTK